MIALPWLRSAAVLAALVAVMAVLAWTYQRGAAGVQARWDLATAQATARAQADAREAEQAARKTEQDRQQETERIAHEQATRAVERDRRAAAAVAELRGLHTTVAALREQLRAVSGAATDAGVAASAGRGAAAVELLGQCAERYAGVAAAADRLRDQVSGLQRYAAQCQANP